MNESTPLLSVENLSVDFISGLQTVAALKDISFSIQQGETVALVGESGSGKSITALSILNLLPASAGLNRSGQIIFRDNAGRTADLSTLDRESMQNLRGNKIAMIFQEPMTSLNPVMTCGHQVTEALLRHKKISSAAARASTLAWFEKVKLPEPLQFFKRYPHQLSGGQKQRVMIAMAMCCQPALLICDEPTTALDVTVQKTILDLIKELQHEQGMAVLFITHDLGVVAEIADRALVLYKGEIVEQNTVPDLFRKPAHPYTKALLACRPGLHRKGERLPQVSDFMDQPKSIPLNESPGTVPLLNETISRSSPAGDAGNPASPVLIRVEHLSVSFEERKRIFRKTAAPRLAVDDVSFELFQGETLGLVGESGCGKTTLGRTLLRLIEPSGGKIFYQGADLLNKSRQELSMLRKEMQVIFQDPFSSLNPRITIGSAIGEALKVHRLAGTAQARKERVIELLDQVNLLPAHQGRYPHEFSGGQRQRIVIARALALNPSFIICDESVSALDLSVQAQVLNLLNDLKKRLGFTVIFISHDLSVVRYISDRIMVMKSGKIIETGTADEIYFNPSMEYTRKLIDAIPAGLPD